MRILAVGCSSGSGLHFAQTVGAKHDLISVSRTEPDLDFVCRAEQLYPEFDFVLKGRRKPRHHSCDLMDDYAIRQVILDIKRESPAGGYDGAVFYQRGRDKSETGQWENEIQVGLKATKEFIGGVPWNAGASIVVIGSLAGTNVAVYEQDTGYHVAKSGMRALVKFYALRLGSRGIRVNMVTPGEIIKLGAETWRDDNPEQNEFCESVIPLGRIGDSEDVTEVVTFLLEGGKYITGQEIVVDGGLSAVGQGSLIHKIGGEK